MTNAKIFSFGCLPPESGGDLLHGQLWLANQYRNALVEIELARRERYNAAIARLLPPEMIEFVEAQEAFVEEGMAALKRAKSGVGKRGDWRGEAEVLAAAKGDLKIARGFVATARAIVQSAVAIATAAVDPRLLPADTIATFNRLKEARSPAEGQPFSPGARKAFEAYAEECWRATDRALADIVSGVRACTDIPSEIARVAIEIRESERESREAQRVARADKTACPEFGTYLLVEAAARSMRSGSPPSYSRFTGEGRVGVHLAYGRTWAELTSGDDTNLQICARADVHKAGTPTRERLGSPSRPSTAVLGARDTRSLEERLATPPPGWKWRASTEERLAAWRARPESERTGSSGRHQRRRAGRMTVQIRVGSDEHRNPIWATLPIVKHRPLPDDARIKDAWILLRRVGIHWNYSLQLVMTSKTFATPAEPIGEGTIAINLGWRRKPNTEGEITAGCDVRVAYWRNDSGEEGELLLPPNTLARLDKVDDLRGIRDRHFDFAREWLTCYLATVDFSNLDENDPRTWLRTQTRHLAHWRAVRRLAALLSGWEKRRFPGDEAIVLGLRAWAKKDRHLISWQEHQRSRTVGHRREVWRTWATKIARRYARIILCEMKMSDFARLPLPEEGDPSDGRDQRRTARRAAPGELREEIVRASEKTGAIVDEVPNKLRDEEGLTQTCHVCGDALPWDAAPAIIHRCANGHEWDQDPNHVRNLLARHASGPVVSDPAEALAMEIDAETQENSVAASGTNVGGAAR